MTIPELYLDLLKKKLTEFKKDPYEYYVPIKEAKLDVKITQLLKPDEILCKKKQYSPMKRAAGKDFPLTGETMIGLVRLNNLQNLFKSIEEDNVDGDCLEAGVWQGGACIFLNALNKIYSNSKRKIWVADSFEGLPPSTHKEDLKYNWDFDVLKVSLEKVKSNFSKYKLLDNNVKFLKGWFKNTLPNVEFDKLALLRVDGDMYESTMDVLTNLYSKVEPGGYVVVDDYFGIESCERAVNDFIEVNKLNVELIRIDWTGVYWRKPF
jgi:O-methyltransferase